MPNHHNHMPKRLNTTVSLNTIVSHNMANSKILMVNQCINLILVKTGMIRFRINSNFNSNRTCRCPIQTISPMCSYLVWNKSKNKWFQVINFFKLMLILLLQLKLCKNLRKLVKTYRMTVKKQDIYLLGYILRLLKGSMVFSLSSIPWNILLTSSQHTEIYLKKCLKLGSRRDNLEMLKLFKLKHKLVLVEL